MITIEKTEVFGWEAAIRGLRNPMNSWEKSDSGICNFECDLECVDLKCPWEGAEPDKCLSFHVGPNDLKLMKTLANAGTDHRKFMRMIVVSMDITAPLYWWKEFDTYKVGTVANSCSTMHKIHAKAFTLKDFSCEHLIDYVNDGVELPSEHEPGIELFSAVDILNTTIIALNTYRKRYLEAKTKPMKDETKRAEVMKKYWWQMIQLLPSSYNQKRTVMLNYEVLANIYKSRRNHKLDEWHVFCDWIETLPYSWLITGKEACGDE